MSKSTPFGEIPNITDIPEAEAVYPDFATHEFSRHLALFYSSVDEQLETVGSFIRHELGRNRRCVYLADANPVETVKTAIGAADVDVEGRLEAGDLRIEEAEDVYLDQGFDPDGMIQALETGCLEAIEAGYDGLTAAGENTWCFHTDESFDHVLEFEADFDARCPELPITALCQYDRTRFSEASIAKVLRTHEQIVYRGRLCDNPYYVPPSEYTASRESQLNVQLMLEQAYGLSEANRQIDRHRQRLSIMNRVLRHNIRNELNVVLGQLESVDGSANLGTEERSRLSAAREHAERVVELAEKARYVEETIADPSVRPIELPAVVGDVIGRIEDDYPDVRFTVVGDCSEPVVAVEDIDVALTELVENAVRHQKNDPPSVTIELSEEPDTSVLEVRNPGDPIPGIDRQTVLEGRETPTWHGRGLGLWVVKWLVENSYGTLRIADGDEGECSVRIEFLRAG